MSRHGFREIANQLRQAIIEGHFPPATFLPPEPELAERYGASRSLVNRAMQVLAAEGVVRARQGRGTMVTWLPPLTHSPARYARELREADGARGAFDAEIRAIGLRPEHEITTERAAPPDSVADALGVSRGQANCLVRRRRLLASGIPVRLNASWFPLDIAADTVLEDGESVIVGGVKSALAEIGYPQTVATERFAVRPPTDAEVNALEISPERSVLDINHTGQTADGRVVEVTTTVTPAHYLIIETRFPLA
ncbi:GntR family transcriptional regulator [Streptosporangium sp. NPDC002524]|uniref:GntR family transcriptional regulator n=1 Tax=Streptosporangium sp. NPDC002524 TaxID=3154537 RepID=UPI00332AD247